MVKTHTKNATRLAKKEKKTIPRQKKIEVPPSTYAALLGVLFPKKMGRTRLAHLIQYSTPHHFTDLRGHVLPSRLSLILPSLAFPHLLT